MLPKLLTAILLCCSLQAVSQLPVLNWAKAFTSNSTYRNTNSHSRTVGVDLQGSVYTAGLFESLLDFGV